MAAPLHSASDAEEPSFFARFVAFLAGVIAFMVISVVMTPWGRGSDPSPGIMVVALVLAGFVTVLPFTRLMGVGFYVALLFFSVVLEGQLSKVWWKSIGAVASETTAPLRAADQRRTQKRAWIELWGSGMRPLDVHAGAELAWAMQSRCLQPVLANRGAGGVPSSRELTASSLCSPFRNDAFDIEVDWPQRFSQEYDDGWRWTLSSSETPTHWGGQGFLLTMRPEALMERAGPFLELDGQDVLRIRDSASAPSRIVRTPMPVMQKLRACILRAGEALPDSLRNWHLLPYGNLLNRACADELRTELSSSVADDGQLLLATRLKNTGWGGQPWLEPTYISYSVHAPGRFDLRSSHHSRRFLLSADNTLHVTVGKQPAQVTDGPPLRCEIDPTVSCD